MGVEIVQKASLNEFHTLLEIQIQLAGIYRTGLLSLSKWILIPIVLFHLLSLTISSYE